MPIYSYENEEGEVFEEIRKVEERDNPYYDDKGNLCKRIISSLGLVKNATREVWEYDPKYVKNLNPKYVKRRDGVRERYDPTKHC